MVSTDHAPHSAEEKDASLEDAPFGVVGLETAFPLLYTHLVKTQKVSFDQLVNTMSLNPQKVFNLERGKLVEGALADLTIVDLEKKKMVKVDDFASKSQNSPFLEWELQGWPTLTIKAGKTVYEALS
jgi:dihydroorotase